MNYKPMSNYPVGSKIQSKARYVFVKAAKGVWKAEHRLVMELTMGRDLVPGERVFHKNGVRDDNGKNNLVVIKFSTVKYTLLDRRRILYIPQRHVKELVAA